MLKKIIATLLYKGQLRLSIIKVSKCYVIITIIIINNNIKTKTVAITNYCTIIILQFFFSIVVV